MTLKRAFEAGNLPALVTKIMRADYPPPPPKYSSQARSLVSKERDPTSAKNFLKLHFVTRQKVLISRTTQETKHLAVTVWAYHSQTDAVTVCWYWIVHSKFQTANSTEVSQGGEIQQNVSFKFIWPRVGSIPLGRWSHFTNRNGPKWNRSGSVSSSTGVVP